MSEQVQPELSRPAAYWVRLIEEAEPIHDKQGLELVISAIQRQAFSDGYRAATLDQAA